jgi:hypothetical protein
MPDHEAMAAEPARVLIDSEDEGVLVEPGSGRMFFLNESGAFVYRLLQQGLEDGEIVRRLCEEFDVDTSEATMDIAHYRMQLKHVLGRQLP